MNGRLNSKLVQDGLSLPSGMPPELKIALTSEQAPDTGVIQDLSRMSSVNNSEIHEPTIPIDPSISGIIASTGAPLYKVAPVTKILVEPGKALKSPFLVKRQSFRRPDAKVLEVLYKDTIDTTTQITRCSRFEDIQKLVKVGGRMNNFWLNFAVSNMGREDARDFWNTKCVGWRHYVDSGWAEKSLSGRLDPEDLKNLFYRDSVLYNASQSHMVFIPVCHDAHWTLYAFNMCDQKLSILDSLPETTKGVNDPAERHQKTRCNICDALTVTMNFAIDFRSWEYQFPKVPRQQNRDDCGFFIFNFMRLWDGHQLVRWFPVESRELRKDFLAYILLCKDKNMHLPDQISSRIKDLPGKMMDCTVQKDARECATLCTGNQGEHGDVGPSNNASSAHVADGNATDLEASVESLNKHTGFSNCFEWGICFFNSYWKPSGEEPSAMSSAPHPASASSNFLDRCHQVTSDGDGVLHIAARFGNDKIVKEINTRDRTLACVLLSAVNNRGDTTLHCAAAGGSDVMVKFFLEDMMRNLDPVIVAKFLRAQNIKGETCLHEAVRHGHVKIVEILLLEDKKIADLSNEDLSIEDLKGPMLVQIVDNEGISPLYLATTLRRIEIVRGLTKSPYNQDKYAASFAGPAGKTALHAAVVLLDKELVKTLLDLKAGLTSQADESGSTPLHFLASLSLERREPKNVVFLLYKLQPYLNVVIKFLRCKMAQDLGIVDLIMGEDPLSALYADSTGSLPIHIAAAHGRLDIVKTLLKECSYCESSRNASGQTFLHVAVEKEKLDIIEYVCGERKFNRILNAGDQDGNTALHLAVNNASENIFCSLMQNREVCLNFANKEGRTPLDLAFLGLHPKVICMKGPREWIFFDLLHGGGDFGVDSWDHLAGNVVEPDWEKESERVGKSASMLAVCAVLILNAALLAPFNVVKQIDRSVPFNVFAFQTFVVSDSIAFVCSVVATFFCARAGFAMSDGWARLKNLITGTFALGLAALALIITVGLALFLVLPGGTGFLPITIAGFGIFSHLVLGFIGSWIRSTYAHLRAICTRAGILQLICILLFQRSAIQPVWVVPSGSISLLWSVAFVVAAFGVTISVTQKFAGGT